MNGGPLAQAFFGLGFVGVGALLIVGAVRRWAWLVDPPTSLWFCYSQSLVKAIVGTEGCRSFTRMLGFVFVLAGIFLFGHSVFA